MRSTSARPILAILILAVASPAAAVNIDWVPVGDPGNAPDTASNCWAANCGSVPYEYSISKYEVTNAQYAEFLNAKAAADPHRLYDTGLTTGIARSGSAGSYTYAVNPGFENKPVRVKFYDALRFTNWLNNGQGAGDTESGAYRVPRDGFALLWRERGATIFLASENEWYKAAYYDAVSTSYFDYPTGTNTPTVCSAPTAAPNSANCGNVVGNVMDVGAYTGSASPSGTFDHGGNAAEWNETVIPATYLSARGGSWTRDASELAASEYRPMIGSIQRITFVSST